VGHHARILSKYVLRALDVPVSWTVFCWYGTCSNYNTVNWFLVHSMQWSVY